MFPPIPKALLPHSATHEYGVKVKDEWQNVTWPNSQTLSRIRFEPTSKLIKTKDNREVQLSALMFFDCRNSFPADAMFAIGDQIVQTNGAKYEVVGGITPIFEASKPHHYELELS